MTTLHHAIKVSASRPRVFKALVDIDEMAAWHIGGIEGDIAVGSTFYLNARPGLRFGWRVDEIITNERIGETCIEGPGNSVGKNTTFTLSDIEGGGVLVQLIDGDWADGDEHLAFCNTRWGEVLLHLKDYLERTSA
jgi:uncharacterized protein YndB with AHSA1/START domain